MSFGFVAALLALVPVTAPAPGTFLVAKASIDGGPFHRSVILLLSHGDEGTLGVIVNRRTGISLDDALPGLDLDEAEAAGHELYFGGPVGLQGLLFVFRDDEGNAGGDEVLDGVYYSGDRDVLAELLDSGRRPDELHLFLGHSGWAPGQLEGEILRGSWDVVEADPGSIFETEPDELWERLAPGGRLTAGASRRGPPASRTALSGAR